MLLLWRKADVLDVAFDVKLELLLCLLRKACVIIVVLRDVVFMGKRA